MGAKAEHNLTWLVVWDGNLFGPGKTLGRRSPRRGSGGLSPPDARKRVKNLVEKNHVKCKFSTQITNKIARNFSSISHFQREFCRNLKKTSKSYASCRYSEQTYIKQNEFEMYRQTHWKRIKTFGKNKKHKLSNWYLSKIKPENTFPLGRALLH